jgi:hypothetical protein
LKEGILEQALADAIDTYTAAKNAQNDNLAMNTAAEEVICEDAVIAQNAALDEFVEGARTKFNDWADSERVALEAFIAECKEAWDVILSSYCLDELDYDGTPHGTMMAQSDNMGLGRHYSRGCGKFGQVGGYRKDVEIEAYDEVLGHEQELEIKHIENIE